MTDNERLEELRKPLDPKHVKPAPRGKFGDYVDGYHVIAEANRIFGENGWSYTVARLERVSEQTVTLKGRDGDYEQYRVGYLCTVRVEAFGVVKEGCAVGSGVGNPTSIADHHESAVKEAETDALKRAFRSYGNTFGLALYDKTKANVGVTEQPKPVQPSNTGTGQRKPDGHNLPPEEMDHLQEYVALVALIKNQYTTTNLEALGATDRFKAFCETAPKSGDYLRGEYKAQHKALTDAAPSRAA